MSLYSKILFLIGLISFTFQILFSIYYSRQILKENQKYNQLITSLNQHRLNNQALLQQYSQIYSPNTLYQKISSDLQPIITKVTY